MLGCFKASATGARDGVGGEGDGEDGEEGDVCDEL